MDKYINATALLKHLRQRYDEKISLNSVTEITLKEKEHIEYAINLIENATELYGINDDTYDEQECEDFSNAWWAQVNDKKDAK